MANHSAGLVNLTPVEVEIAILKEQMSRLVKKMKAQAQAEKPAGYVNNKDLRLNYALIEGKVAPVVINDATKRKNKTPVAWYYGSKTYDIWLDENTPHGTFCSCPVGLYNRKCENNPNQTRDCKHQKELRKHLNPKDLIKALGEI